MLLSPVAPSTPRRERRSTPRAPTNTPIKISSRALVEALTPRSKLRVRGGIQAHESHGDVGVGQGFEETDAGNADVFGEVTFSPSPRTPSTRIRPTAYSPLISAFGSATVGSPHQAAFSPTSFIFSQPNTSISSAAHPQTPHTLLPSPHILSVSPGLVPTPGTPSCLPRRPTSFQALELHPLLRGSPRPCPGAPKLPALLTSDSEEEDDEVEERPQQRGRSVSAKLPAELEAAFLATGPPATPPRGTERGHTIGRKAGLGLARLRNAANLSTTDSMF